ncbi:MAG: response regulator [Bacteroidota bacterium]
MSKLRILIVEDELLVAEEMTALLEDHGYIVQKTVDNARDARLALEMFQLDVLLIDIRLKGEEDGISIAEYVNRSYALPVIFVTSLIDQDTIDRALKAKPSAYLVKPYSKKELQIAIDMAFHNFEQHKIAVGQAGEEPSSSHYSFNQHVFIKDRHRLERVEYGDILWMKAESSYVSITTVDKQYLLTSDTLGSLLPKFDYPYLLRVHRSYAVNINKVKAIDGNQLCLNDINIPIGKNYRPTLKQHFNIL